MQQNEVSATSPASYQLSNLTPSCQTAFLHWLPLSDDNLLSIMFSAGGPTFVQLVADPCADNVASGC
jgi:hypothetical protein